MNWSETCLERMPSVNFETHDRVEAGQMASSVLTFLVCGSFLLLNILLGCKKYDVSYQLRGCYAFGTFEHDVSLSIICCLQQVVFWAGAAHNFVVYGVYDLSFCRTQAVLTQFLFIAEILEVGVIFFYSDRLVVGTISVSEIRKRYLVCTFALVFAGASVFTLAPMLMEFVSPDEVHIFGGVGDGVFCWISCSMADWIFVYSAALPITVYCTYTTCRQCCSLCQLHRRGKLDSTSRVMVYLYKRVGFMLMLLLTIMVSAAYTVYATTTLDSPNGTSEGDGFTVAYWSVLRLHGAISIAPLLVPDTLCSSCAACRRRKVSLNSPRMSFMEHREQIFYSDDDDDTSTHDDGRSVAGSRRSAALSSLSTTSEPSHEI